MLSKATATQLQEAADTLFGRGFSGGWGYSLASTTLLGLEFSFTIADPFVADIPFLGCSTGFTNLFGYGLAEVFGRQFAFLIADSFIDDSSRAFCEAVRDGNPWLPTSDYPYAPTGMPCNELISVQANARKDGTMFNTLSFMKLFELSSDLGDGKPYIVGVQTELKGDMDDIAAIDSSIGCLKNRMNIVKKELGSLYFMECPYEEMTRQVSSDRCSAFARQ
jgi:hypothetical protein